MPGEGDIIFPDLVGKVAAMPSRPRQFLRGSTPAGTAARAGQIAPCNQI